jgi:dihydroneopterin aldolase
MEFLPGNLSFAPQVENNAASDVVFVDSLRVSANIGPDCWDCNRAQPIDISVQLYLKESYLNVAGASDDESDSVDFNDLTRMVHNFINAKSESKNPSFSGKDELIEAVTLQAFDLAGEAASAVRVIMGAPEMILLASGFYVDVTTIVNDQSNSTIISSKRVLVEDLVLPVIIGVNPAERKSKQRVKVNIIFHENTTSSSESSSSESSSSESSSSVINYKEVVAQLCQASFLSFKSFESMIPLLNFRLFLKTGNGIIQFSDSGSIRNASP